MVEVLFRKLDRYAPLTPDEKSALRAACSHVDTYEPGQDLIREGDETTESALLIEGLACRFKMLEGGTRQILSFQIAGDFCDLHSFYLERMDHGIGALTACRIAKFPHQRLKALMADHPRLARALNWDVAMDGAIQREWMISMGRRSSVQQVAHLFCELLVRLRAVGLAPADEFELPVTQTDLGDAFGISTVHVNRKLQELRRRGLIQTAGRRIVIPDFAALKEAAGFDPSYLQSRGGS